MIGSSREAEFRTLYQRSHLQVLSYCLRRTTSREAALDAASETYVVAWRRFDDLPDASEGDALVWLFAVARRVLANQRRSEERQIRMQRRVRGLRDDPDTSNPEAESVTQEEHHQVLEALARLSDDDQELLRLATWEELPGRDLAEYFGSTENAINVRLHRARQRLAREYDRFRRSRQIRRALGGGGDAS